MMAQELSNETEEQLGIHPAAELPPTLTVEEYESLKASIGDHRHGQLKPIITYKGRIIDGRSRYRICQELGIEPKIEELTGDRTD